MNQVVVVPYPSRAHIFPLLNLCHIFSNRFNSNNELVTVFTVIVTEEWLAIINSDPNHRVHNNNSIRFVTIPNVLPLEAVRQVDTLYFYILAQNLMKTPFDQLLDSTDLPVNFIIADVMLHWTFEIANRRKIPVAAYWPMSASMFCLLYYINLLCKNRHDMDYDAGSEKEFADNIPGLSPISLEDLPWPDNILQFVPHVLHDLNKTADSLLLTTVYELEADAIDAIVDNFQKPMYTIGPNLPQFQLQPDLPPAESNQFSWLDSKPPRSVLYVSLGCLRAVSRAHIDEILAGLKQSCVNFLWTTGREDSRVIGDCGSNGLVVDWCDQWRVLQHSSVGGFMSHCDWNSTKESLFLGVPMLTFPITGDQLLNSKLVFDDLSAAWKVRVENFMTRETIAVVVRQFMDLESELRRISMQNVEHVKGLCRESVEEGGPANKEIDLFIRDSEKNWDQNKGN